MQKPIQNTAQDNLCHGCPKFGSCPLQNLGDDDKKMKCNQALFAFVSIMQKKTLENLRRAAELDRETAKIQAENAERLQRMILEIERSDKERIEAHYGATDLTLAVAGIYYKEVRPHHKWWMSGGVVGLKKMKPADEKVCKRRDLPRLAMVPLKRKTRIALTYEQRDWLRFICKN